jgi:hypothetical protein
MTAYSLFQGTPAHFHQEPTSKDIEVSAPESVVVTGDFIGAAVLPLEPSADAASSSSSAARTSGLASGTTCGLASGSFSGLASASTAGLAAYQKLECPYHLLHDQGNSLTVPALPSTTESCFMSYPSPTSNVHKSACRSLFFICEKFTRGFLPFGSWWCIRVLVAADRHRCSFFAPS